MRVVKILTISLFLGLLFITLLILTQSQYVKASTVIDSNPTTDQVWATSGSPYFITSNYLLSENLNLSIMAGVEVRIETDITMNCRGKLSILGTDDNPVRITNNNTERWRRIFIRGDGSSISNCTIENGVYTIHVQNCENISIKNLTIRDSRDGLFIENSNNISLLNIQGYDLVVSGFYSLWSDDVTVHNITLVGSDFSFYGSNRLSVDGGYLTMGSFGGGNSRNISFENLTIIHNLHYDSQGPLISFGDSTVEIHACNMLAPLGYLIRSRESANVNASDNYWGITDDNEIRKRLLIEDTSAVNVSNPLSRPVPLKIPQEWRFIKGSTKWTGEIRLTDHTIVSGNLTVEDATVSTSGGNVPPFLYILGRMDVLSSVFGNSSNRVHLAYGPSSTGIISDSTLFILGSLPVDGRDMIWRDVTVDSDYSSPLFFWSHNISIIRGHYSPRIRFYYSNQISLTGGTFNDGVPFIECYNIKINNSNGTGYTFTSCHDISFTNAYFNLSGKILSWDTISNITIDNLTAHSVGDVILLEKAVNVVIHNSTFDASVAQGEMGIYFRFGANNVTFENVDFVKTKVRTEVTVKQVNYSFHNISLNVSSVHLRNIRGLEIINANCFLKTGDIVSISNCKDVELLNLTFLQGEGPSIWSCTNVSLKQFSFTKTFAYGLRLEGCSDVEIENGFIGGSIWCIWAECNGSIRNVTLKGAYPLTMNNKMWVENLTIISGDVGIGGVCYASTFTNCSVSGTRSWPLHLRGVTGSVFRNCTFKGGVWIEQGSKVLMENCTTGGLNAQVSKSVFRYCVVSNGNSDFWSGNVIENCTFVNSTRSIRLVGDRCRVTHCTFSGTSTSIRVEGDSSVVYHNEIDGVINVVGYDNLFFFNNILVNYPPDLSTPSQWDNGSYGNYWRIYSGTDRNGDGIGDTPFVIKVGNVDNYPLVDPLDLEYPIADAGPDVIVPQHTRVTLSAARSTDNDAIARYRWTFKYSGETVNQSGVTFSFLFDEVGIFVVTLSVEDNWFNVARDRVRVTVLDTDLPELVVDRTLGETVTGSTLVFNLTATDNVGVSSVIIEWWQGTGTPSEVSATHEGNGTYLASISVPLNTTEDIKYRVSIVDFRANEFVSDERSVKVVDVFPPSVVDLGWTEPTTGDEWIFWVEGTDNIVVSNARLEYTMDGSDIESEEMILVSAGQFGGNLTIASGATGALRFRLIVVDGEGLEGFSEWTEVTILDNDPPVVEDRTSGPATTGDDHVLSALLIDNVGVVLAWCEWEIEGEVGNTSMDGIGEIRTTTVEVSNTPGGVLRYRFGAMDASGQVTSSKWYEMGIVDNDPPETWFVDPPANHERGTTLTLIVEAVDNNAVDSVKIVITEPDLEYPAVRGNDGIWTVEIPPEALSDSSVEFTIRAMDRTLNEGLGGPLSLELVDTMPPEGSFHLEPDPPTTGDALDVGGEVHDVSGISSLDIEYIFGTAETETFRVLVDVDGTFELRIGVPNSPLGTLRVRLVVEDTEGNILTMEWRSWNVSDNDPPVAKPPDDTESRVGEKLILEDGGSLDNLDIVNWTWTWTERGKARVAYGQSVSLKFDRAGEYVVTLTVTDGAGNTDQATMAVEVSDVESSVPGVLIIAMIAACIIAAVAILLWRRAQGSEE